MTTNSYYNVCSNIFRENNLIINERHPELTQHDMKISTIREDLLNLRDGDIGAKMKVFQDRKKDLENSINQSVMDAKRQKQERRMQIDSITSQFVNKIHISDDLLDLLEVIGEAITAYAKYFVEYVGYVFGLNDKPEFPSGFMSDQDRMELAINEKKNNLVKLIAESDNFNESFKQLVHKTQTERLEKIKQWNNRPERLQAIDTVKKIRNLKNYEFVNLLPFDTKTKLASMMRDGTTQQEMTYFLTSFTNEGEYVKTPEKFSVTDFFNSIENEINNIKAKDKLEQDNSEQLPQKKKQANSYGM